MNTTLFVTLTHVSCCKCGLVFGIEASHHSRLRGSGGDFYCPNGHCQCYIETDLMRAEKAAKRAQELLAFQREQTEMQRHRAERTERQLSAARGRITKIKNRVAGGVCPCCNRTFQNLARHMKGQHPDFTKEPT